VLFNFYLTIFWSRC